MTNIIDLLKKDHQQLRGVMDQIEALKGQAGRYPELFDEFKKLFNQHDEAEEQIFYPAIDAYPELVHLANKGIEAHHVVRIGIIELRLVPFVSERWAPKFSVIRDSILSHMQEEEEVLFPAVERVFNEGALKELGQTMLDNRKAVFK